MADSRHRLSLTRRRRTAMPPTTLTLADAEVRYLAYHRSHNHSAKTLEHDRETLADFRRFLAETGRPTSPP